MDKLTLNHNIKGSKSCITLHFQNVGSLKFLSVHNVALHGTLRLMHYNPKDIDILRYTCLYHANDISCDVLQCTLILLSTFLSPLSHVLMQIKSVKFDMKWCGVVEGGSFCLLG